MAEHLKRVGQPEAVVLVGKAQGKTPVFRTQKRCSPETGRRYAGWVCDIEARVWMILWTEG